MVLLRFAPTFIRFLAEPLETIELVWSRRCLSSLTANLSRVDKCFVHSWVHVDEVILDEGLVPCFDSLLDPGPERLSDDGVEDVDQILHETVKGFVMNGECLRLVQTEMILTIIRWSYDEKQDVSFEEPFSTSNG